MSRKATVSFAWADDEYTFRLPIGQLLELQEKAGAGPAEIFSRIATGKWRVQDLSETIRLGLIGGGMEPVRARRLVQSYVHERPLMESVLVAQTILGAALSGAEDEPVGKEPAPDAATETAGSNSPPSSAPAR